MINAQNFFTSVNVSYMLFIIAVILLVGLVTLFDKKPEDRLKSIYFLYSFPIVERLCGSIFSKLNYFVIFKPGDSYSFNGSLFCFVG